jgi:hypothetical protein
MIVRKKNPDLFVLGEEAVVDASAEGTRVVSDEEARGAEPRVVDLGLDPFRIHVPGTNGVRPGAGTAGVALGGADGPGALAPGLPRDWRSRARRLAPSSRAVIAAPLLAMAALAAPMVVRELRSNSHGEPARVPVIAQLPATPRADAGRDMTPSVRAPERSLRPNRVRKELRPSKPINPPTSSSPTAASPPVPSDPVSASPSPAPTGGGSADRESFGIEN